MTLTPLLFQSIFSLSDVAVPDYSKECGLSPTFVYLPDKNRTKQRSSGFGPGLRRSREMATIGNLENMPSVLFQPLETIMAKKKPGKADTSIRVIKETLTKSALINLIAEQNDIPRKTAIGVFNTLESVMLGSVHPRGVGEFTLPSTSSS
jgi:hypothetical protein